MHGRMDGKYDNFISVFFLQKSKNNVKESYGPLVSAQADIDFQWTARRWFLGVHVEVECAILVKM